MNRELCRQNEVNYFNQDITGGFLPFSTRATLNRNSEGFLIGARSKKPGTLFFILVLFIFSCGPSKRERENMQAHGVDAEAITSNLSIVKIDSCEYIMYIFSRGVAITHKANCKNHGN